jgi:hypothetical protein
MSYLHRVRLHFSGVFRANPSTVNNDTRHFNLQTFKDRYQTPQDSSNMNGWWNPGGSSSFRLSDCKVTRVCFADGTFTESQQDDPIIGLSLVDATDRPSAKIVDLDPEQQFVSQLWGLQINIVRTDASKVLSGEFLAASFADMWWVRRSPFFQSVLQSVRIDEQLGSRFLQECIQYGTGDELSIKVVADRYSGLGFTYGRIYGTIGPRSRQEPRHFASVRYLRPLSPDPSDPANPIYCVSAHVDLSTRKVLLDLGNALQTGTTGDPMDIGTLSLGHRAAGGNLAIIDEIPYRSPGWLDRTAAVCELPSGRTLTDAELAAINDAPLLILKSVAGAAEQIIASENTYGLHVRPDTLTYRMDPGDSVDVAVHVSRFGRPAAGVELIALPTTENFGQGSIGDDDEPDLPPQPIAGVPGPALSYPTLNTTGPDGVANVTIVAADPGTPRFLDGQLYGVLFVPREALLEQNGQLTLDLEYRRNPHHSLSVLVWSSVPDVPVPNWNQHVKPIFELYGNLYPIMKGVADLHSYDRVVEKRKLIEHTMSLPESHPSYMPVTRDLSRSKRELVLRWLRSQGLDGLPPKGSDPPAIASAAANLSTSNLSTSNAPTYGKVGPRPGPVAAIRLTRDFKRV